MGEHRQRTPGRGATDPARFRNVVRSHVIHMSSRVRHECPPQTAFRVLARVYGCTHRLPPTVPCVPQRPRVQARVVGGLCQWNLPKLQDRRRLCRDAFGRARPARLLRVPLSVLGNPPRRVRWALHRPLAMCTAACLPPRDLQQLRRQRRLRWVSMRCREWAVCPARTLQVRSTVPHGRSL